MTHVRGIVGQRDISTAAGSRLLFGNSSCSRDLGLLWIRYRTTPMCGCCWMGLAMSKLRLAAWMHGSHQLCASEITNEPLDFVCIGLRNS